jgi:hypothetical protein
MAETARRRGARGGRTHRLRGAGVRAARIHAAGAQEARARPRAGEAAQARHAPALAELALPWDAEYARSAPAQLADARHVA